MLNRPPRYIFSPSSDQSSNLGVLSKEEDMQKLLEECKNGKDNVQLLNQLLTFARPGDLSEPVIRASSTSFYIYIYLIMGSGILSKML